MLSEIYIIYVSVMLRLGGTEEEEKEEEEEEEKKSLQ